MDRIQIGIIGGGASGMMAAISAAQEGALITILEGGERLGKKLLATGNGKCNLGNEILDVTTYCGGDEKWIHHCLSAFGTKDTIDFFRQLGVLIRSNRGYLYPLAEQAAVVLDALRTRIRVLDIRVVQQCKVRTIEKKKDGKFLVASEGASYQFDRVILACGGMAAPKTGSDGSGYELARMLGHRIVPVVPALVQLRCRDSFFKEIAGVRCDALIQVSENKNNFFATERGELQITDYGISGIPVFQLSRKVNYVLRENRKKKDFCVEAVIDFLPDYPQDNGKALIRDRLQKMSGCTVEEFFNGILNKKLMHLFIKLGGLKRDAFIRDVPTESIDRIFSMCRQFTVHINGSNSFENAQTCAGGVDLCEVTEHMESKICEGLYFAGELLDVDGRCGGYNLQWAWTSGYLAGTDAARKSRK